MTVTGPFWTDGFTEPPPLSRVHELGRKSRTELAAIYIRMCGSSRSARMAVSGWNRDQIITAIRNIEDPR